MKVTPNDVTQGSQNFCRIRVKPCSAWAWDGDVPGCLWGLPCVGEVLC